jgi:hypothetical protein
MKDAPIFVLLRFHCSVSGALPLRGISQRLGGVLSASSNTQNECAYLILFDREVYGKAFVKVVERAGIDIKTTILRECVNTLHAVDRERWQHHHRGKHHETGGHPA